MEFCLLAMSLNVSWSLLSRSLGKKVLIMISFIKKPTFGLKEPSQKKFYKKG